MLHELNDADIVDLGYYRGSHLRIAAPCPDGDWVHHCIHDSKAMWQEDVLDGMLRYLPSCPHVVDVGSHSGSSALWFSSMACAKSVTAIEPDPDYYKLLEFNISLNGLEKRVRAVNAAVWDDSGRAHVEATSITDRGTTQYRPCGPDFAPSVPRRTIDEIMSGVKHKVDVLYLEMEGYEALALKGARKTIGSGRPVIAATFFKPTASCVNPNYDCMRGYVSFLGELAALGYYSAASKFNTSVFLPGDTV